MNHKVSGVRLRPRARGRGGGAGGVRSGAHNECARCTRGGKNFLIERKDFFLFCKEEGRVEASGAKP